MYEEESKRIAELMRKRLEEKHEKYGDAWKEEEPIKLQNRMFSKILQYRENCDFEKAPEQLVDIANQAMLLALRLLPCSCKWSDEDAD